MLSARFKDKGWDLKSDTLRSAVDLNIFTVEAARKLDAQVMGLGEDEPVLDWLVYHQYVNSKQVEAIRVHREHNYPREQFREITKRARFFIGKQDSSIARLDDVVRRRM